MSGTSTSPLTFMAVGDIILGNPPDPEGIFAEVKPTFDQADVLFGQCESNYSHLGEVVPQARGNVRYDPRNIAGLTYAGFDVMSLAGNHALDLGRACLVDTMERLNAAGVKTVGVGRTTEEARKWVVVESGETRIAFLGYAPASDPTYAANKTQAGNNPMVIYTYYRNVEPDFPGAAPEILTFIDPEHLGWMKADIDKAREEADIVIVSFHWGLPFVPVQLAGYESELGRAAIDAGADLILGHHQHILKGIEVYNGKVIFHGMNHLTISINYQADHRDIPAVQHLEEKYGALFFPDPEAETWNPFQEDANKTIIVKTMIADGKIQSVGFLPCTIHPKTSVPALPKPEDSAFTSVVEYMDYVTREAGLDTKLDVIGDTVMVVTD